VIFPDASIKFFLTASIDERVKRRLAELEAQDSEPISFEELREQIRLRDEGDTNRVTAPLRKADDAIEIDTTAHTLEEVVKMIADRIVERFPEAGVKV
jgi:cytidylate kinase